MNLAENAEYYSTFLAKFMELFYHGAMIKRIYEPLEQYLQPNKVLVIYGPRRVGKTTLLRSFLASTSLKYKLDSGDNIRTQQLLSSQDFNLILAYSEGYELLAIDEAQEIPNIGKALKIMVDQAPNLYLIATGSSSFELAGQMGEPLTGRKRTLTLFPLAQAELLSLYNRYELRENLETFLIYGTYPEVIDAATKSAKIAAISEIANSYLLKDILAFDRVKNSRTLLALLKLLAFQVGSEVSLSELAMHLSVDAKTVQRYLDLLEKAFVVIRLGGFSRNLRKEVTSKAKYYFYDNGLRNALIAQFNSLDQRNDIGQLWENFLLIERLKYRTYFQLPANPYFWRTYAQQEIDLVEEREGKLFGYEFKWSTKKSVSPPASWLTTYPNAEFTVITPDNYLDFVLPAPA
ncbi:MAG: ATP-binding protein [Caldilineaceae bacterium]